MTENKSTSPKDNSEDISTYADTLRIKAMHNLNPLKKEKWGQYFSSVILSRLMASMFQHSNGENIVILDAGAGVGSLFAAVVDTLLKLKELPKTIHITAYEVDPLLCEYLQKTIEFCAKRCSEAQVAFSSEIIPKDFIDDSVEKLAGALEKRPFNCIILNPPYGKIKTDSRVYHLLKASGLEATNYYSAFIMVAENLLMDGGEMIFITPRSFCNGPYFKKFRKTFLATMRLRRIHVFTSRTLSFQDEGVLQENIIIYSVKTNKSFRSVIISSSGGPEAEEMTEMVVESNSVVLPNDPEMFIHIVPNEVGQQIAEVMQKLKSSLSDIGLQVSTGKIIDFRLKDFLRNRSSPTTVPLIRPFNISSGGFVRWPLPKAKKAAYLEITPKTSSFLTLKGNYVLVKRFTTNEEKKRIVAAICETKRFAADKVAFENRINFFHTLGKGIEFTLAKGLTMFLNSTFVDSYFRQFSGHTQVNATDLRSLHYPPRNVLIKLGIKTGNTFPSQKKLDQIVQQELGFVILPKKQIN